MRLSHVLKFAAVVAVAFIAMAPTDSSAGHYYFSYMRTSRPSCGYAPAPVYVQPVVYQQPAYYAAPVYVPRPVYSRPVVYSTFAMPRYRSAYYAPYSRRRRGDYEIEYKYDRYGRLKKIEIDD